MTSQCTGVTYKIRHLYHSNTSPQHGWQLTNDASPEPYPQSTFYRLCTLAPLKTIDRLSARKSRRQGSQVRVWLSSPSGSKVDVNRPYHNHRTGHNCNVFLISLPYVLDSLQKTKIICMEDFRTPTDAVCCDQLVSQNDATQGQGNVWSPRTQPWGKVHQECKDKDLRHRINLQMALFHRHTSHEVS